MKTIFAITLFAITVFTLAALIHKVESTPVAYAPHLLHLVECDDTIYEIMIPPGVNQESFAKGYCMTLRGR